MRAPDCQAVFSGQNEIKKAVLAGCDGTLFEGLRSILGANLLKIHPLVKKPRYRHDRSYRSGRPFVPLSLPVQQIGSWITAQSGL